jgi:hypothetical protein
MKREYLGIRKERGMLYIKDDWSTFMTVYDEKERDIVGFAMRRRPPETR